MAEETDWTDDELRAAAAAYLSMLRMEQSGADYSKAEFRRQLRAGPLSRRSDGSIEFRMQNISHVLETLRRPRIAGYKPAVNVGENTKARLVRIIDAMGGAPVAKDPPKQLRDEVPSPELIMGIKAVFGYISSHVLCFGGRGSPTDGTYFSVAASAARKAETRPYVIAIGGGRDVEEGFEGLVLNLVRATPVYGLTSVLVSDPEEADRLEQWPTAIALHNVWRFVGAPHLVRDLGFLDRTILAGAQDGIIHPDTAMKQLWTALQEWPIELDAVVLPGNFYDANKAMLVMNRRPMLPASLSGEEGNRIWKLQRDTERDRKLSRDAKRSNFDRYGAFTCEACSFDNADSAMFDAHHPTPLAVGKRTTLAAHLQVLCPTCHRKAHRKSKLDPFSLHELREWVASGRK